MTTTPDAAPTLGQRIVKKIFMRSPIEWLTAGFLIILLISGLFGGLNAVAEPPTPTVRPGVPIAADPFTITVDRVYRADGLPGAEPPADAPEAAQPLRAQQADGRFIVVEGTLTNTSDETVITDVVFASVTLQGTSPGFRDLRVPGRVGTADNASARVFTTPDLASLTRAQPGVTYPVIWRFEQTEESAPPSEIGIVVNKHIWRQNSLEFMMQWLDPTMAAQGTMPLPEGSLR